MNKTALSDLAYRALTTVLAYHVDALQARHAALRAGSPRRSRPDLPATYVQAGPATELAPHVGELQWTPMAPARALALGVVALILVALVLASPQSS